MNIRNRRLASPFALLALAVLLGSPSATHAKGDVCPGSSIPPGGAACRFTLWSSEGCGIQLAPDGADCRGLEKISSIFVKLRDAAGFSGDQLKHLCGTIDWPETPLASYTAWNHCVNVNFAFLRKHGDDDVAIQSAIAHELSHGVQDYRGELAWAGEVANDESAEGEREFNRRRRVLEAQADVISIQLLERAGFPLDTARKGFEIRHGRAAAASEGVDPDSSSHPTLSRRWLNMTIAASWLSVTSNEKKRLAAARRRLGAGDAEDLSRLFDGTSGREPFSPLFQREDFTDRGDIQLKRLVSERLGRQPPDR